MKDTNLSLLSDKERRHIELKRQASLLIYSMRKGKISRGGITVEINKLPESEQEKFKEFLNYYKDRK